MTDTSIEFAEPPQEGVRNTLFTDALIDAMRANPARWVVIRRGHTNSTAAYQWGQRNSDFEVRPVRRGQAGFDIYARFVGEVAS